MFAKYKTEIFFFLTLVAGIVILYPFVDYQAIMATGDHGRDLYAAQVALKGHLPYRDYWWVYGPLMPYYYALCFKFLGTHIPAVLVGKALLAMVSSLFFYLALTTAAVPCGLAFIGAVWFLVFFPEFFITYDHIGGTALLMALIYCVFQYLWQQKTASLFIGLFCVFLLSLIKINFGVAALLILLAAVAGADFFYKIKITRQKISFYACATLLLPLLVAPIYLWLLKGLPDFALRQCFPYIGAYTLHHTPVLVSALTLLGSNLHNIFASPADLLMAVLVILCAAQITQQVLSGSLKTRIHLLLTIAVLIFFYIINLHEFLASGVFYRVAWAKPFAQLLMFLILATGTQDLNKITRFLLYATLTLILGIQTVHTHFYVRSQKTPSHYLGLERARVFLGNEPAWLDTVTRTVSYLQTHLKDNELFFALPYDPLYYFLTDKISPTRQIIFFDHEFIPPRQEQSIIADLEDHHVNWIVLSSRRSATEYGLGTLGKTYCPLIGAYIEQNFVTVTEFGDWTNDPGWAWNHGVRILKRKQAR